MWNLILFWSLAPFLHLWPRKLGPFHKRAARPSLIITSLSNIYFLLRLKFDNDVMIKLAARRVCEMDLVYAATKHSFISKTSRVSVKSKN